MAINGDVYRYYSVVVFNGSGCIFHTNSDKYSYILTVKHNLIKDEETGELYTKDEIKVSRTYEDYVANKHLVVHQVYVHPNPNKDYAIIEVQKISNPEAYSLNIGKFVKGNKVTISGFPKYQRDKEDVEYRTSLEAVVDINRTEKYEYDLSLEEVPITFSSGAAENIIGFSGSPIFYEKNDALYLCGVFPKLNDSEATHLKVVGFDLSGFIEILNNNGQHKQQETALFIPQNKIKEQAAEIFKKFKWAIGIIALMIVGMSIYIINPFASVPTCENFTSPSDLNILIAGDKSLNELADVQIDDAITNHMYPFNFNNKYITGKTIKVASGIISDVSKTCGAHLWIKGTPDQCKPYIIDNTIKNYLLNQFGLNGDSISLPTTNINKLTKLLKCYLLAQKDNNFLKKNYQAINYLNASSDPRDTIDQIILQTVAKISETAGKQDSALMLYKKISDGGINPEFVYKRQEVLAEKLNKTYDAIEAQTGLIKIAQQKKDTVAEAKILKKRAENYEKTNQSGNQLEDYKKVKKLNLADEQVIKKIETLEDKTNATPNNFSVSQTDQKLIKATNLLINAKKFEEANVLLEKIKSKVAQNDTLKQLKTEVDYNLDKINAEQIPDSIKEKNKRLSTQIKVDKIKNSKKIFVHQFLKNNK